jgi:hypothetical protein
VADVAIGLNEYEHRIPGRDPPRDHDSELIRKEDDDECFQEARVYWNGFYVKV